MNTITIIHGNSRMEVFWHAHFQEKTAKKSGILNLVIMIIITFHNHITIMSDQNQNAHT